LSIGKAESTPLKRKSKKQKNDQAPPNENEHSKKTVTENQVTKSINADESDSSFDSSL
jgi:hypothetical protein